MSCKTIYKKRGKFCFRDEYNMIRRFKTEEEAVAAGGTASDEEVQVSGGPYTVPAVDISIPSDIEEGDEDPEEDGED